MPTIDVVSDAGVALKWFRSDGEEEVDDARALLAAHQARTVALLVLDVTAYEVGNALLRGRARAGAGQVATVLEALAQVCPAVRPDADELRLAANLADRHALTLYDAAYAAVADNRGAALATLDRELLQAGLGRRPSELVEELITPTRPTPDEGREGPGREGPAAREASMARKRSATCATHTRRPMTLPGDAYRAAGYQR